jgi:hypothetical protein
MEASISGFVDAGTCGLQVPPGAYRLVGFFMVLCPSSHGAPSRFLHDVLFGRPNG